MVAVAVVSVLGDRRGRCRHRSDTADSRRRTSSAVRLTFSPPEGSDVDRFRHRRACHDLARRRAPSLCGYRTETASNSSGCAPSGPWPRRRCRDATAERIHSGRQMVRAIGFFAQRKLKTIQLSGGPPQTLCDAILPRGGTWSRDGVIVFSAGAGRQLYRVPAAGGTATPLPGDASNHERHWPSFLPDGRHFVYCGRPQKPGIYVAAIDSPNGRLLLSDYVGVAYRTGTPLGPARSSRGAPAGALLAYPFDPTRAPDHWRTNACRRTHQVRVWVGTRGLCSL